MKKNKKLIVVGDRVLIKPDQPDDRTSVGLYLPQTVLEKEKVLSGKIISTGPGIPLPDMDLDEDEPWRTTGKRGRYIPMQAKSGDHVFFLKKHAIEIKYEEEAYLIVPQSAILVLLREEEF